MIPVNFRKELIQFPAWHRKAGSLESCLELALIQLAIVISIYRFEEGETLVFGVHDE